MGSMLGRVIVVLVQTVQTALFVDYLSLCRDIFGKSLFFLIQGCSIIYISGKDPKQHKTYFAVSIKIFLILH